MSGASARRGEWTEDAVYDARQLCEMILRDPVATVDHMCMAEEWLRSYGRSWQIERAKEAAR